MKNETLLPTDDLKKYGIINEDNTFSKKLTADDVTKFMKGYTIVADNDKKRATFQLVDDNTRLKVIFLERDKKISEIIDSSKDQVQYSDIESKYDVNDGKNSAQLNWIKSAFVFDKETNKVVEFDLIKNATQLTAIIADKKDIIESSRYKTELFKLKEFLQEKIDKYPEIAKEITNDINIVSKEINTVNAISPDSKQINKEGKNDIQLNVNDSDLYEDANRRREEEKQEEDKENPKSRGFRR
ncbi:hypothetical protein [Chryseobacterium salivictor]|uniref:DUF3945 domain-containing protein n=1 Tax=Chryseobacterium salivictor TaxID=2547600 RepID=A0A4P6ZI51_9FLAO|nr:hypothetical protein [Chryseobacterium salivictor]QBO59526.1 hypothetical protein NBC122_02725 [Chryseobacterium salivictor]